MRGLGMGMGGGRGLLGGMGGMGLAAGMGLGGGLGGSRSPSLRGSNYSLEHLDRQARSYHYQPPYVEDWEDDEEMRMLQMQEMMMAQQGVDMFGPGMMGFGNEDYMGGMGGGMLGGGIGGSMGGRRGRL